MYNIFEQLMYSKGLTSYKVAKETGITQATLSRWKTGKVSPSIETLQIIASYFGVSVDYLLGNEQKEKPVAPKGNELQDVYFNFAMDAQDNGIDPSDIDAAIDMIKRLRNK